VEAASSELKAIRRQLDVMPDKVKGMENVLKFDRQFAREPVEEWTKLQRELGKLDSAVQKAAAEAARVRARAAAAGRNPDEEGASAVKAHENLKGRFETLQQEAAGRQAAAEAALQEIEKDQAQLAKLREEEKAWEQKARSARETLKKAESELAAARSEAEKTAKMLTADKERLEKLRAEYHQLRAAPAAQTSARS
jgi:chromosome segregation ATPase